MKGQVTQDTVISGVPASKVWRAYRGVELERLVNELLSDVIGRMEVLQGDGGVGTIINVIFPPGTPGGGYQKEKFTKMDDELRVKETEVLEGGFKDIGCDAVWVRFEIIEKDVESTIVRNTIEYEIDDTKSQLASALSTKQLEIMAEAIGTHLAKKK